MYSVVCVPRPFSYNVLNKTYPVKFLKCRPGSLLSGHDVIEPVFRQHRLHGRGFGLCCATAPGLLRHQWVREQKWRLRREFCVCQHGRILLLWSLHCWWVLGSLIFICLIARINKVARNFREKICVVGKKYSDFRVLCKKRAWSSLKNLRFSRKLVKTR